MPNRSMKETIGDWEVLHDNLAPQLGDIPHLTAGREALQALITEAKTLENEREIHKSALRDTNHQRVEMMLRGRELARRITDTLRGHFGPYSEELIRYGIKPRPREIRRRTISKAEKAALLAQQAARAAVEAEAERRRVEALQPSNENFPPKRSEEVA